MSLSTEIVREFLDYNPDTGIFTWRARGREWFKTERGWKAWNARFSGAPAGCIHTGVQGYPMLVIYVLGKGHYASRLAFLAMGESLPEQVDHPSRDSLDNRWRNLKASNSAENHKNLSMRRDNTSGVTGVSGPLASGKWRAQVKLGGKRRHLGYFTDIDEAAAVVSAFYAANGFTDSHGQSFAAYQEKQS